MRAHRERPEPARGPGGPRRLLVEKHHWIRVGAGREVPVLRHPDGERFVHVIEGGAGKAPLHLPDGWRLESVKLAEDWVVRLPTPVLGQAPSGALAIPARISP